MRRFAAVLAAVVLGGVLISSANAALYFLFSPTAAQAGEPVSIRLGGTPADFGRADRRKPFKQAMRIYLAPESIAGSVRSRFDRRIHFVGSIVPDRNTYGRLVFKAPPLDSGTYVAAAWCPGCAPNSNGRTFFVLPAAAQDMALSLELPAATSSVCPVSKGSVGNGILSTSVPGPDGILATQKDGDMFFQKLWWLPKRGFTGKLVVRGERLDAPGEMKVLGVNWGHSGDGRGSWASAVEFPSEGCWRLTGRVGDVELTYVVKVVKGCGDTYTPPPCGRTARSRS